MKRDDWREYRTRGERSVEKKKGGEEKNESRAGKKRQFAKPWPQYLDLSSYSNAYISVYMTMVLLYESLISAIAYN